MVRDRTVQNSWVRTVPILSARSSPSRGPSTSYASLGPERTYTRPNTAVPDVFFGSSDRLQALLTTVSDYPDHPKSKRSCWSRKFYNSGIWTIRGPSGIRPIKNRGAGLSNHPSIFYRLVLALMIRINKKKKSMKIDIKKTVL